MPGTSFPENALSDATDHLAKHFFNSTLVSVGRCSMSQCRVAEALVFEGTDAGFLCTKGLFFEGLLGTTG